MFSKLIIFVIVVLAIWYGFKIVARIQKERAKADLDKARTPPRISAEDMVKCAACGVYVPAAGAKPCGRPGCPQQG